jgi:hypothetical protein
VNLFGTSPEKYMSASSEIWRDWDEPSPKSKQVFTVDVVTVDEFKKILLDNLIHDVKDYEKPDLIQRLLDDGFPKFDTDNLGKFMEGLKLWVFLDPVCVDVNDSMFYWLVSGTSAILVKKTKI